MQDGKDEIPHPHAGVKCGNAREGVRNDSSGFGVTEAEPGAGVPGQQDWGLRTENDKWRVTSDE